MRNFLLILLVVGLATICITGCEKPMAKPMMDAVTSPDMPTKDDPEAFAMAFVQAAVDLYKAEGLEAAIAHYNDPASVDGQWYVYIIDENDIYLAHAISSSLLGTDLKDTIGLDGSALGVEIAMATSDGLWTEYLWHNPETNKIGQKRSWSIRYDGYLFGAGYYEPWGPDPATFPTVSKDDPATFTRSIVLKAIARYEFEGLDATTAYYNDPANIDGQWYVYITDENDMFVAHPQSPHLVGTDLKDVVGDDGTPIGTEIAKATGIGLWTEYLWPNPETGEDGWKRSWSIRHNGYLFGSGYYEPVSEDAAP